MTDRDKIAKQLMDFINNQKPFDYEADIDFLGKRIADWILENRPECEPLDNVDVTSQVKTGYICALIKWTKNMAGEK